MKYLHLLRRTLFQSRQPKYGISRFNIKSVSRTMVFRFSSSDSASQNNSNLDMEQLFLDQRVRFLLKRLTGYDPLKVFQTESLSNLSSPSYRFLTDEQLTLEVDMADQKAEQILQFPPVKFAKKFEPRVLEKDPALKGFLDPSVKFIFMDATHGFSDNERLIVVREPDGTLREATRDERHRTNQIFYPVEERHIDYPFMFQEPHINDVLEKNHYKTLLDNACLHFEPDDERYIEICHKVYNHINSNDTFDQLKSTRHYGGMVFYLVYNKIADTLLLHLVSSQQFTDAYNLLRLFYIINPLQQVSNSITENFDEKQLSNSKFTEKNPDDVPLDQLIELLEIYINNDSTSQKSHLQMVLQKLHETKFSTENKDKSLAQN